MSSTNQTQENEIILMKKSRTPLKSIRKFGEGGYGIVHQAIDPKTNEIFAVKVIKDMRGSFAMPVDIIREIGLFNFLKRYNHQNIVKFYEAQFNEKDSLEIKLELCEGNLWDLIKLNRGNEERYNIQFVRNIMYQILNGISFLHSNMILHRDLKPGNILIKGQHIKITDFGHSRFFSLASRPLTKERCTLLYKPPESLLGFELTSTSFDMWSIGCIFAELLCGDIFFKIEERKGENIPDDHKKIISQIDLVCLFAQVFGEFQQQKYNKIPPEVLCYYEYYNQIIKRFKGKTNPIGLREFLKSRAKFPITDEIYDLLSRMLNIDPLQRIEAADALNHPFFKPNQN